MQRNKQSMRCVRNAKHHILSMYMRDQQPVDYSNIIWLPQHHHLSTTVKESACYSVLAPLPLRHNLVTTATSAE